MRLVDRILQPSEVINTVNEVSPLQVSGRGGGGGTTACRGVGECACVPMQGKPARVNNGTVCITGVVSIPPT